MSVSLSDYMLIIINAPLDSIILPSQKWNLSLESREWRDSTASLSDASLSRLYKQTLLIVCQAVTLHFLPPLIHLKKKMMGEKDFKLQKWRKRQIKIEDWQTCRTILFIHQNSRENQMMGGIKLFLKSMRVVKIFIFVWRKETLTHSDESAPIIYPFLMSRLYSFSYR